MNQRDNGKVNQHIGQRIHETGNAPHLELLRQKCRISRGIALTLCLLLPKGAYHTDTGQVFARARHNLIEFSLHALIERQGGQENPKDHRSDYRNCDRKNECRRRVYRKGHDHGAENNKRRTQKETQHHVDTRLHLVHIAGHTRNQGVRAKQIQLGEA